MATPNAPTILQPSGSAHYTVGSAFWYGLTPNHPDSSTVTGYDFLLSPDNGATPLERVTIEGTSLAHSQNILHLRTVTASLPVGTPLSVWGRTKNAEGWGAWGSLYSLTITNNAPTANTGSAYPVGTVTFNTQPVSIQMQIPVTDSDGDRIKYYQVQLQTAAGGSINDSGQVSCDYASGSNLTFTSVPLTPGSYRWRIRLWDATMLTSANPSYTSWMYFDVAYSPPGGPPVADLPPVFDLNYSPSPSGSQSVTGSSYTFVAKTRWIDPEGGYLSSYEINVYDSSNNSLVWNSGRVYHTWASGSVLTVTGIALPINKQYYWRMRVYDALSQNSGWSSSWSFSVSQAQAPNQTPVVTLSSPASAVNTITPTFVGNFSDTGTNYNTFTSYQIEVQRVSDSAQMWLSSTYGASNTERTYKQFNRVYVGTPLTPGQQYRWRAQVWDDGGLSSGWSGWVTFTPNVAPNAPINLLPTGTVVTLTPTFTGSYSTNGTGTMTFVQVQLYRQNGTLLWDTGGLAATGGSFSVVYSGPALTAGQSLYWQARNLDSNGLWGPYSGQVNLTVQSTPNAPINLAPTSSLVSVWPNQTPIFAGDNSNVSNATMNGAEVIVYQADGTTQVWDSGAVAASGTRFRIPYTGPALTAGQTIKWKARTRASDTSFWGPYSELQTLVLNTPPTTATGQSPAGGTNITTLTPTLTWLPGHGETYTETSAAPNGLRQVFYYLDVVDTQTLTSVSGYPILSADIYDQFSTISGWTQAVGTWGVNSNRAIVTGQANNGHAYKNAGISDAVVSAFVKHDDGAATTTGSVIGGCGLLLRRGGATSYWVATIEGTLLKLCKNDGGTIATVATAPVDVVNGYDNHVAAIMVGAVYSIYVNGQLALSYTDNSNFNTSATEHGIFASQSASTSFGEFIAVETSGGAASHTVPGATLALEKQYTWRTRTHDGFALGPWSADSLFTTVDAPQVTITSPSNNDTISSPTPTVTFTYTGSGGRPQVTYRLQVMKGPQVVYDSGALAGTNTSVQVPLGYLLNGNQYKLSVTVTDTFGLAGTSSPVQILTVWTPPASVVGLDAFGDDTNAAVLLTWEESDLLPIDFVRYELRRQIGDGAPTVIAKIYDRNTTSFTDYYPQANEVLTYSIIQVQRVGVEEIPSGETTATARIEFRDMWLTSVRNPELRVRLRDNPSRSFSPKRDEESRRYWGDEAPTKHVGRGFYTEFQVSALVFGPDAYANADEDWTWVLDMLEDLSRSKDVVCYVDGRGRRIFANFTYSIADQMPEHYQVSLTLEQAKFTEDA